MKHQGAQRQRKLSERTTYSASEWGGPAYPLLPQYFASVAGAVAEDWGVSDARRPPRKRRGWRAICVDSIHVLRSGKDRKELLGLTNDRTRFPYTYIGMDESQHTAWHAPMMSSETLTPLERMKPFAKKVEP